MRGSQLYRGSRGLWRGGGCVPRLWECSRSAPVTPGFRLLSHAVGPAWTLLPSCSTQCLYWSLALKICQWFPHYTKEQNKIQASLTFCINMIDPRLSFVNILYHPLPHPESSSCLGSSLFSNPPGSFLIQSCWVPLFHIILFMSFLALMSQSGII